ncbi:serine/threonine-protein phosphatase 1 regulatory subunit 10 isoform X1 [Anabrus simplex]|uniref:serine/threonine-protein phosphatase 1 regulatory subunit 10 isoform X1 n=1 Tax=Anabrus simplex TaxID=316456 RepID=UPI0035A3AC2D
MPRIDPLQLLKCLSVLLSPSGGIKSKDEVQRLASLMTKFSKKLVSKCIYIQILKTTKSDLLGMFMSAGGWYLIYNWLSDAIVAKNWPLIQELLELLLLCPVNVDRLRINNCPKLIKGLSKDGGTESVRLLASKLVEQWLKIVKGGNVIQSVSLTETVKGGSTVPSSNVCDDVEGQSIVTETKPEEVVTTVVEPVVKNGSVTVKEEEKVQEEEHVQDEVKVKEVTVSSELPEKVVVVEEERLLPKVQIEESIVREEPVTEVVKVPADEPRGEEVHTSEDSGEEVPTWNGPVGQLPVYKIMIRDGKQVLAKVFSGERTTKKSGAEPSSPPLSESSKPVLVKASVCSSTSKASDSLVEVEPVNKVNSEVKLEEVKVSVNSKSKLEKQDSSEGTKSVKDSQKKGKDAHSSSKASDKKSKSLETSKDKSKENPKDKSKDKSKDKEKEKENNKSKEKKPAIVLDKAQLEKDRATLAKLIPPTISKLGKIPKVKKNEESAKPSEPKNSVLDIKKPEIKKPIPVVETKKASISIEVRRNDVRPKTVKKFHSKFRSTGLEEEVKPPPSRPIKKLPPPPEKKPIKFPSLKRPSPPRENILPEKKLKPTIPEIVPEEVKKNEKNGSIKLIPPRPKPCFLQESDMFMDALNASSKKEPRKRKRRISISKEGSDAKKETGNKEETTPPSSPIGDEIRSPPLVKPTLKFYQDTMETEEDREGDDTVRDNDKEDLENVDLKDEERKDGMSTLEDEEDDSEDIDDKDLDESEEKRRRLSKEDISGSSVSSSPKRESTEDKSQRYPGGVLIYHKLRKGPKKTVRWKPEKDLEVIKYFELDETERVNVTKTFLDMKQMERSHEREAFMLARKLPQDDIMEEKTPWLPLIPIDLPPSLAEPGKCSREKDIQYAREKATLQAIYFNRAMIPDSPAEPDMEIHATTDPTPIPLDDVTGNADSVNDFQNTPWPEPKPMIIPQSPPQQFPLPQQTQFPSFSSQSFNTPQMYPGQPVMANNMAGPVNMIHPNAMTSGNGDWRTGDGKVIAMNDIAAPMDIYNQGVPPVSANMGMHMNMNMNMGNMNMGMASNMGGAMPPEMNYNMMGGEDMGPYPPQGFSMGGPPNMFGYRGSRGPGMGMGGGMRGGRGSRGGPGGPWFRPMGGGGGSNWQGGGRGGRGGNWGGPSRTVCKHFRGGYCRLAEKCPYLHPGVNGPQY